MIKFLALLIFKPISIGANNIIENGTIKSLFTTFTFFWFINSILVVLHGGYVKYSIFCLVYHWIDILDLTCFPIFSILLLV